jgi:signal transduction histidine kinase
MSLKLRFVLIFSFFVAIILAFSSLTIYYLYYGYREEEFYSRVKAEGQNFQEAFTLIKNPVDAFNSKFGLGLGANSFYEEKLAVFDSSGNLLFSKPTNYKPTIGKNVLLKIKHDKEFLFMQNKYQYVGLYSIETGYTTLASGYDFYGYKKVQNLRVILFLVFVGGLILTWLFSFLFVQQAFKPVLALNKQINQTTIKSLEGRLEPIKNYPEMNEVAFSFNAMMDRLSNGFESQRSFVQHASHELRTPLAIMLSQTESALNHTLTVEQYHSLLASLKEDQQELIALTNSLLVLSQYEQLNNQKDWPSIRIDEIVVEATSQLMQLYPEALVEVSFKEIPESDQVFFVIGSDSLLKSAFLNLLKNAYLYSSDKKVTVQMEAQNEMITVTVENKGETLSSEESIQIMEPFYRGKNAINNNTKGFGLGLSIISRILLAHKGAVSYAAMDALTNQFKIVLPHADRRRA